MEDLKGLHHFFNTQSLIKFLCNDYGPRLMSIFLYFLARVCVCVCEIVAALAFSFGLNL